MSPSLLLNLHAGCQLIKRAILLERAKEPVFLGHEGVFLFSDNICYLVTLRHNVKNQHSFFLLLTIQNDFTFNGKTMAWRAKHNQNPTIKSKMFGENTGRKQMERRSAVGTIGSCVWTVYRKWSWVFDSALEGFSNLVVVPETSITQDRCRLFLSAACPKSIKLSSAVNVLPPSTILTLMRVLNTNISSSSVNRDHV